MTAQHITGGFSGLMRGRSVASRLLFGIMMALMAALLSPGVSAQEAPTGNAIVTAAAAAMDGSTSAVQGTMAPSVERNTWNGSRLTMPTKIDGLGKPTTRWIACGGGICLSCWNDTWGRTQCRVWY